MRYSRSWQQTHFCYGTSKKMGNIDSRNERFYNLCGLGKAHLVEKMLENDRVYHTINIDWLSFESQSTPLLIASANGHDLVVDVLLRNNAKIEVKDSRDASPLHHAAQRGYTEIAKKLIKAGSEINARDKLGWTPLMKACYWAHPDIILTLLEAGTDIDAQTEQGRTALHELCRSPPQPYTFSIDIEPTLAEISCMLIDAGADVNKVDNDRFTPLMYAAYHNHPGVALVLLESNCNMNDTDKQGWTALHWAVDRDNSEIVQLLIDKGCRTDLSSQRNETVYSRIKSTKVKDILKHVKRLSTISMSMTNVCLLTNGNDNQYIDQDLIKKLTRTTSVMDTNCSLPVISEQQNRSTRSTILSPLTSTEV
ncbi:unnamed protein product [Didymodactylos carnosus]|uniref:Uncharacterized protein n=1 Tax=Didymodactylos carnosus TaxID=1234261 RepID=A0A813XXQ2_9BILA|nr:unnamed protein product [Didymodactylos carnosus]CAF0877932.1 unnamed protein product [Didymodactylos carnosus]CAF3515819.1 unnamed protein product [Didymodactylos carnosus]CAF3664548.1 unnamed protein product [Didymodactylos carnosus]